MNVEAATMQVDYWKARSSYLEYRELVRSGRGTKQDEQLRRAYREISRGEKVIDVNHAIATAGLNDEGLPKLAIGRADWDFTFAWWHNQRCVFSVRNDYWLTGQSRAAAHNVAVRFHGQRPPDWSVSGKAQMPMIPPAHRPKGSLEGYRILFEAVWQRLPPVDPILLRHIGGPFHVVLAQWDLSPLEQAVLRAKL